MVLIPKKSDAPEVNQVAAKCSKEICPDTSQVWPTLTKNKSR
jgi:hypothetical protein